MFISRYMVSQRFEILQITITNKTEEESLFCGLLVLVAEIIRDVGDPALEAEHVFWRLIIVWILTSVPNLHNVFHFHVNSLVGVYLSVLS